MTGQGKLLLSVILLGTVAACDGADRAPAGGYGYFDPPPPAPLTGQFPPPQAISSLPPTDGAATASAPAAASNDPNAALAADVGAALDSTAPGQPRTVATAPSTAPAADPAAIGTQPLATASISDTGIDPNDESINLNLTSQEQQKREREAAAQLREQQRQQLVVVETTPVPQQDINANVVAFARQTTHPVGTKRYNRPAFRDRLQANATCRRFGNDEEAQRQFLANGGPNTDRYNLDPDGDGFACGFDPEVYRKLNF